MESAVLVLLASSMGVMFGWQPMPDGSPRYEYVVQIEPEMAATLHRGQSIPITSDIPEEVGPIGRIRIVVGRGELPRQELATRLKPWPTSKSATGIVETQLTVPPVERTGDRYANQATNSNPILPPGENRVATNPFGRTLQQSAQQAREQAGDAKPPILPPTGNELFGNGGVASQAVQNTLDKTADQLQRSWQQGAAQVADRTDQQLRAAVSDAGKRVGDAVDRFGRSLSPEHSILSNGQNSSSGEILPYNATAKDQSNSGNRIDRPIEPPGAAQPERSAPPANFVTTPPAGSAAPRYGASSDQAPPAIPPWPKQRQDRDAFDLANRPSGDSATRYAEDRRPALTAGGGITSGPKLPAGAAELSSQPTDDRRWPTSPATPEIRREMLDRPIGELQTVEDKRQYQKQVAARPPFDKQPANSPSIKPGAKEETKKIADNNEADSVSNNTLIPPLLSVLLSSSVFGNLYLFWSYLDVRSKYQGVVHGTAGRRERYDD